jgi:uridine kinase
VSRRQPIVIGIAGGTGSGKTSIAAKIMKTFKERSVLLIKQDSYYRDQSHITFEERLKTNYDHPNAFDNDLLMEQIYQLQRYEAIEVPVYDYTVHTRSDKTVHVEPKEVIILEGILVLEDEKLRDLMDIKLYVDTDADLRILRRMVRDIEERGRTVESVIEQYLSAVRPMHNQFVEPSKCYADVIIPEGGQNHVAIDLVATKIEMILAKK